MPGHGNFEGSGEVVVVVVTDDDDCRDGPNPSSVVSRREPFTTRQAAPAQAKELGIDHEAGPLLLVAENHHRTTGVSDTMFADRPKEHPNKLTVTAAAQYKQVRPPRRLDQRWRWMTFDDGRSYVYIWVRASHLLYGFVECSSGVGPWGVISGEGGRPSVGGRPLPRRDHFKLGSGRLCLIRGPLQGANRRIRSVDTDDDLTRFFPYESHDTSPFWNCLFEIRRDRKDVRIPCDRAPLDASVLPGDARPNRCRHFRDRLWRSSAAGETGSALGGERRVVLLEVMIEG